jgi:hypothetical protein
MGDLTPTLPAQGRRRSRGPGWRVATVVAALVAVAVAAGVALALVARIPGGGPDSATGLGAGRPEPVPVFPASTLAPAHGALFGAWVQPASWSGADAEQSAVASFEHSIGRKLAIDQLYVSWGAPMPMAVARWDLRHGSIPMISWDGARSDLITDGTYDAQIRAAARQLKSLHGPVMLRWFAEMDLGSHRAQTISPANFVAAWRYMHDIFSRAGAANVRWVWCPSGATFATGVAQRYYPGSSYVDWTGADGYNWAPELPATTWRSFAQIFSSFYIWGLSAGKPMLVGEYGTVEGTPGAKAAWFRQADYQLRMDFPGIRAVVYFNSDHPDFGKNFDWRVTSSPSALAAFRAFANDPYFRARPPI